MNITTQRRDVGVTMVYRDGTLLGCAIQQGRLRKWRHVHYDHAKNGWASHHIYTFPHRSLGAAIEAVAA